MLGRMANGGMVDRPLLALMGEGHKTEMVQPLSAGHPERAAFISDVASEVARTMGSHQGGPDVVMMMDTAEVARVTGRRVMYGMAAKGGA